MSTIASTRPRAAVSDRLLAALPLTSLYLWLSIVYCVEAWKRVTPWLFTDELEFTQLSRAIAATGHAARRGEPHSFRSLYTVLIAPLWLIHDVSAAFATIKYVDVLVMTSVVFPTYFLARMVTARMPALFAAAGAATIPSLAYSSWIVEETFAYPYAALCFLLIAKALYVRSRGWVIAAAVASAVAPLVRSELSMVAVTFFLALLFMLWSSDRMRVQRASWSWSDWLGFLALVAGAIIVVSGILSHHSNGWLVNTAYNWTKKRIFVYGDWAAGAVAIGVGILPFILGLAALVPARREARTLETRVFRSVSTAGIIAFGIYTGMKAAYLSQVFASRVEERNLIYISPLLFIGTALVLERRRVNLWAFAGATVYTLYLIVGTPLHMTDVGLYSDALGLAILEQANRYLLLGVTHGQWVLLFVLAIGVSGTAVLIRGRRSGGAAAIVLALGILGWTVTGEIAAAAGNVTISRDIRPTLGEPFTWVDDRTGGKPTLYLAQGVGDQNPEWLLEFWNRSITTVSSLDNSIGGPGPAGAPNITRRGTLYWTLSPAVPGRIFDYAVEDWPCIDFAGTEVASHRYRGGASSLRTWRLVALTKPNRLRAACVGISPDGWSLASDSTYFRFAGQHPGWLRITLGRPGFSGSGVDITLGTIATKEFFPVFGSPKRTVRTRVAADGRRVVWLRTPTPPFAVTTVVRDKFVPSQVSSNSTDGRTLGAIVTYRWFLTKRK